jgi:hypothetical protein
MNRLLLVTCGPVATLGSTTLALDSSTTSIPTCDRAARDLYTSPAWAETDQFGAPRMSPLDPEPGLIEQVPTWLDSSMSITMPRTKLGSTTDSNVFEVHHHPDWVIKYHGFCTAIEEPVDATIREAFFLDLINQRDQGIANKLIYFSSGTPTDRLTRSERFPTVSRGRCENGHPFPIIRYMISTRVGKPLNSMVRGRMGLPFDQAIEYGISMFRLLSRLHALNVIHGDIHGGNIALSEAANPANSLVLIDFGRAEIDSEGDMTNTETDDEIYCHGHSSHWESRGMTPRISFRDDAFRATLVLAVLVHGYKHKDALEILCEVDDDVAGEARYMEVKGKVNFFDWSEEIRKDEVRSVFVKFDLEKLLGGHENTDDIRNLFGDILDHIRALELHETPDYDQIVFWLEEIKRLAAEQIDSDSEITVVL